MRRMLTEKELLFIRSKESIQEIFGWKVLIFLPKNVCWRMCLIIAVMVESHIHLLNCVYNTKSNLTEMIHTVCEVLYAMDTLFSTMHFIMKKTRELRYGERKPVIFLVLDYFSMIPFDDVSSHFLYAEGNLNEEAAKYLGLLKLIRLYQIPVSFSLIKTTMFKIKPLAMLTVAELFVYHAIIVQVLSCFLFLQFDAKLKEKCLNNLLSCLLENALLTSFLLEKHFVPPFTNFPLSQYTYILIVDFFIGYLFLYGCVVPVVIFMSLKISSIHFAQSKKLSCAKKLADLCPRYLNKKVFDYFKMIANLGRGDSQSELLEVLPLSMRKSICCDMHWEAMRHSFLLQDLSIGCKRSLAICMISDFVPSGTNLFVKNEVSTFFLYVESGSVQVMSEENSESAVLSLTRGTVLGEMSFFLHQKSKATVRTASLSLLHLLRFRDLFEVLTDYPKDRALMLEKVKVRLELAKTTHKIKSEAFVSSSISNSSVKKKKELTLGNVKWIKKQYRALENLKNAENLMNLNQDNERFAEDYQRQILNLEGRIDHTSLFLSLLSISHINVENTVCLKKSFPWLLDPDCDFVTAWKNIVFCVMIVTITLYPAYIGWVASIPQWFFDFSLVVSFIYSIDAILLFFTSVRTKNFLFRKFSSVLVHRIGSLSLYIDILAALPLQLFPRHNENFSSNLYYANTLTKIYILYSVLQKWSIKAKQWFFIRTFLKFFFLLFILVYFTAAIFNLTGVECIFYKCGKNDWYAVNIERYPFIDWEYGALIRAGMLGFGTGYNLCVTDVVQSFVIYFVLFFAFHSFLNVLNGASIAAYIFNFSSASKHKLFKKFILKLLETHKLTGSIRNRVLTFIDFISVSDPEHSVTGKEIYINLLRIELKTEVEYELKLRVLKKCQLFRKEEDAFLLDLSRKAIRVSLPPKSVLVTLGTQTRCLYVVDKGFVQLNSFIEGDLNLNMSKPIKAKRGDIFPVIDVLSQTPAAITAVTISHCDLLMLDLEDVLSTMINHGIFKDVYNSIIKTNLSGLASAKLAVSVFKDSFRFDKHYYKSVFARYRFIGPAMFWILKKRAINSEGSRYLFWESSRVVCLFISFTLWPVVLAFGNELKGLLIWLKCLFIFDLLIFSADFYIRLHVAYYNELGIHVTHTFFTATHYLSTAFVTDFVAFSPNIHILYIIITEEYDLEWYVYVTHMLMRSLSLYRVFGFFNSLKDGQGTVTLRVPVIKIAGIACFIFLVVHYYICLMVNLCVNKNIKPNFHWSDKYYEFMDPSEYYFIQFQLNIAFLVENYGFFKSLNTYSLIISLIWSALGMILQILLYSFLFLRCIFLNKHLTRYQFYLRSFIKFLDRHKAEENVINLVIEHFENEWQQSNGYNLQKILSVFPQALHEDILLPLYKQTLTGIASLSEANEYLQRVLARNVEEVYLNKNYSVIFHEEVVSNIYFVHSGQCLVESSKEVLYKGSLIGDIKQKGIMMNTIITRTKVVLLKISSKVFFTNLGNFYKTKKAYQAEASEAEDFISSIYFEDETFDLETVATENEYLESEFIVMTEEPMEVIENLKEKKLGRFIIIKGSKKARILRFLFFIVAYATMIVIPLFVAVRVFSWSFLLAVYSLDFLWILKIILCSRMVSPNNLQTHLPSFMSLTKYQRLKLIMKVVYQGLTFLPLEVIPLAFYRIPLTYTSCYIMRFCYLNRLLRMFYIFKYLKSKKMRLTANFKLNVFGIILLKIALINVSCAVFILKNFSNIFKEEKCYTSLTSSQWQALSTIYLCTLSVFIDAELEICEEDDDFNTYLQEIVALTGFFSRAFFIENVLMILFVFQYNKSVQVVNFQALENYLSVRDVSPVLRLRAEKYYSTLVHLCGEGSEPSFFKNVPFYLKLAVTEDLYVQTLSGCYAFQNVELVFLKQLAMRLHLNVFFPGDYITERDDVDNCIYFILKGQVYCIKPDDNYEALETAVDLYRTGDHFGMMQGIFSGYPHVNTYRAKTLSYVLVLHKKNWEDLRLAFPETAHSILSKCKRRKGADDTGDKPKEQGSQTGLNEKI